MGWEGPSSLLCGSFMLCPMPYGAQFSAHTAPHLRICTCVRAPSPHCCPLVCPLAAADGQHAFATCMVSYGFMGDVMAESESYRWLGPLRYDMVRGGAGSCAVAEGWRGGWERRPGPQMGGNKRSASPPPGLPQRPPARMPVCLPAAADWGEDAGSQPQLPRAHLLPASSPRPGGGGRQGLHRWVQPVPAGAGAREAAEGVPGSQLAIASAQVGTGSRQAHERSQAAPALGCLTAAAEAAAAIDPTPARLACLHARSTSGPCFSPLHLAVPWCRRSEWVHLEGEYAGIMLVIMPCRSEKSQQGVARCVAGAPAPRPFALPGYGACSAS